MHPVCAAGPAQRPDDLAGPGLRSPRRYLRACGSVIAVGTVALLTLGKAAGQQPFDEPSSVCERAAGQAEREWRLPQGLLAAIGVVESGRRAPAGMFPIIWPWNSQRRGAGILPAEQDGSRRHGPLTAATRRACDRRGLLSG